MLLAAIIWLFSAVLRAETNFNCYFVLVYTSPKKSKTRSCKRLYGKVIIYLVCLSL